MNSRIRKAGLVALAGAIIGVGGYGFEKEEKLYKQTKISFVSNKNPGPAWDTYSEFGFTFKYPPELNLKAADTATAEEGSISSIKPRENGKLLHLRWMRGISGKQSIAEKVLRPYIRSREGKFYLGESKWLKVHNQQTAFSRFYTSDEKGVFLNVVYAWYAEDSNRTFVLCCGALWKHPEFVADGSRIVPRWPKLDDDPSYDFCQSVLKSFEDKLKRTFKHSERGYSLSVKGTVTKEPYPTWASLTSKRMAYLVQAEVKNTDERPFCFDCVKGAFRPDSGTPLVIESRIRDVNEQEPLKITLSSGQDKEWQFGTDGYTQSLLAKARGKPLKFSLTFFLKDEVVAGPYFTTLPDIKRLPIIVGTIIVGGKKCSLVFSKSLKSAPAQIRQSSKTTDGQDWIKLASLTGGKEMKQSDSFRITTGEAKIRYTLTGERAVDGEQNQTSIMLFRKGLTTAEAAKKGREGANIFPMKMVSGSGPGEYIEKVEPGTYSIYAYSPAGASWTVQVYEKRNHLEAPPKEPIVQEPAREDRPPKESVEQVEQEAKNCLKIKYLDLSERLIYYWSFRYDYQEYDSPPPKGYWYSLHGRENEKEKMSHTLYLISEGRFAEKRRVQILSDEIDRFRMKWKKRKIPSQREEGNLERTSLLLLTIDGRTFALDYQTDKYWKKDISPFADNDKYHTNIHLYIVGKERKNDQLIDYSLNLGYDRSILFGHDPSKIPVEIAVIKTESGIPNRPETELPEEDVSPTVSVEQVEQELPKEPASLQEELYKQTKIAFGSNRDGNYEIYVMNVDGSEQKRLTNNPAAEATLSWSPDGKKIAFASERDGNTEIYVMNPDGSEQRNLTNSPADDGAPSWSPNGKKIAFTSRRDGNPEIYIMNADGTEQKRLTKNPADDYAPSWSPDGKKIAFWSSRDGNLEIYIMNADGTEQKNLTNNSAIDASPSWSPDGRKIAFSSTRDGNGEIYIMNADGTEQKRLTNNPADDAIPSWSSDGKKIAFTSRRDGNPEIYIMNADGTEQKRLTNNPAWDVSPSWSPFLGSQNKNKPR